MSGYAGQDWLKVWLKGGVGAAEISPFAAKVADILGDVFFGIYHLNIRSIRKVDWNNDHDIEIVIYGGLSTFDSDQLTRLVVLCHDRMVRLEIRPANFKHLRLCFGLRTSRAGEIYTRHPTLEDAAARIRADYQTAKAEEGRQP